MSRADTACACINPECAKAGICLNSKETLRYPPYPVKWVTADELREMFPEKQTPLSVRNSMGKAQDDQDLQDFYRLPK